MKLRILLCVILLAVPALLLLPPDAALSGWSLAAVSGGAYFDELDQFVAARLPMRTRLRQLGLGLGLFSGQTEQNDIFISKDGLIKNIDASGEARVDQNIRAILSFAAEVQIPTYLTLIPTASAILQQQLPPYAEIYNNQKQTIEDIYRQMSGKVTVADVYPQLYNKRAQYIYYRTENNLTALGGYYVYAALGAKLVGRDVLDFGQFDIAYLPGGYYGDLYQKSPYQGVRPDTLSMFRQAHNRQEYGVTHYAGDASKSYYTLYPLHLAELDLQMDIYFGGISAITDLHMSSPQRSRSLLIFGDKTALAYLPFLTCNYGRITLVDLFQLTPALAETIDPRDWDQILFAYSLETFDTDIPRRVTNLLPAQ